MTERLTRQQMAEKYPNQWLGIANVQYKNNNGITLEAADVVHTDKTEEELLIMQIKNTGIIAWYTTADQEITVGMVGVV